MLSPGSATAGPWPANSWRSETAPLEAPFSTRLMGRIRRKAKRPAPVWRPGSFKQQSRIHRHHLARGQLDIEQHARGRLLRGRHRFAASLGPFDHHRTGGCQQL